MAANIVGTAKRKRTLLPLCASFLCHPSHYGSHGTRHPVSWQHIENKPILKARFSVSSVCSSWFTKIWSQKSMNIPPRTSITATTATLSNISSILSLKNKPKRQREEKQPAASSRNQIYTICAFRKPAFLRCRQSAYSLIIKDSTRIQFEKRFQ